MARDILTQVRIAAPCSQSCHSMKGDDRVRFCAECKLNVYNIAEMSSPEARALLESHEGRRLCGRLYQRRDGALMARNCPPAVMAVRKRLAYAVAVVGALAFSSLAIAKSKARHSDEREQYRPPLVEQARDWPMVGPIVNYLSPRMVAGEIAAPPAYRPSTGSGSGP